MIHVHFGESERGPARSIDCGTPARLLDLCDESRAPVGFGCRAARCTTCRVVVLDGADLLDPPASEEAELLSDIGAPEGVRLACQAVIRGESGLLALRWIGPRRR